MRIVSAARELLERLAGWGRKYFAVSSGSCFRYAQGLQDTCRGDRVESAWRETGPIVEVLVLGPHRSHRRVVPGRVAQVVPSNGLSYYGRLWRHESLPGESGPMTKGLRRVEVSRGGGELNHCAYGPRRTPRRSAVHRPHVEER